jgi:hypothetical protein
VSTKRIAVIVGAGWSKVAGWPDTSGILDEGAHLVTPDQAARFRRVWDAYDDWKTTAPNPSGDVFMAEVERGAVRGMDWPSVVEVVAGTVASMGADRLSRVSPRYADSLMRPNQHPSHRAFFAEVFAAGDLAGVVSLNYDLLIEKVLRPYPMRRPPSPGFHYGGLPTPQVCVGRGSLPWRGARDREPLQLSGTIPVWKPHGSLNWHRSIGDITLYPDLRAAFRGRGEAAIIPPVASEATVPSWLAGIWAGAADLLAAADEWRVVGYSLPPADVALREMLRAAAAVGRLSRIVVRNKTDKTRAKWEDVAGSVPLIFGPSL